ncbi:pitrilysin family protein [Nocardioides nanhaiensis]|uniref:Pitrilysin family protein n=1 Tax=Nocardioides nanhaiensis TaxID=1476871 RepID=A0ABP8VSC1_9ACTN
MTPFPAPTLERLPNGLRLVVAPGARAGVAAVAVHVGVGFRAEPPGASGLAHLFEHLMFAGSAHVPAGGHFAAVEAGGGRVGAHTRHDHTEFFDLVAAPALGETVALEADRLAGPRLDQHALSTQVDVIAAEIAQQVDAVPFGGFPWRQLPAVLWRSPTSTHDGYGDLAALRAVTLEDCERFFERWYDPRNVVVTLEGELEPREVDRAREALAAVPARTGPAPTPVPVAEPPLVEDRHLTTVAANAPAPAWAAGFRMPDPVGEPQLHAACTALATLLPLHAPALRLTGRSGWYGVPADARTPDVLVLSTHPRPGVAPEPLAAALRESLAALAEDVRRSTPSAVLRTAAARLRHQAYQRGERTAHRARRLGATELLFGDYRLDERLDPADALGALPAALAHVLDQPMASVLVTPAGGDA